MTPSQSTSTVNESRQRQRTPDWRAFYKNGLPKEVIVIDDDTPPPRADEEKYDQPPPTATHHVSTMRPAAANGSVLHADKKRKTAVGGKAYDPVYHKLANTSQTQTPYYNDYSPTTSTSTGRTTSALTTTATTSLGSNSSYNNLSNGRYDEVEVVGQKRKRTRKATADEAKQREIEIQGDAYSSYCPPPKPPIKAKDVYVAVAPDVHPSQPSLNAYCRADLIPELILETSKS